MSHPDDSAEAADPKSIDILIRAAAPEKGDTWRELRERYRISFHPIADRKGVTFWARGRRIEFDHKTMTWLWLLGFSGWRAFRLHAPHLLWRKMSGASIDGHLRSVDPGYGDAEGDFEAVLYAVRDFPKLESVEEDSFWPAGVPRQQTDKQGFDIEQQAAFDLTMVATAYMLLHEVRHVMFNADGGRPSAPSEEIACDAFARKFLLEGVDDYAISADELPDAVRGKRAAGIALGAYAIHGFTQEDSRGGSADYPPVADRLDALFPDVNLPEDHWFWNFAASLLVAVVVSRDHAAVMPELQGRALCYALVDTLRQRHLA